MTDLNMGKIQKGREKQFLLNGEIHNWYRFIFAYPDHLVTSMLTHLNAKEGEFLLDPFCGTGTTLIEGMKFGMNCIGIEANPVCVLASRVKTNWGLSSSNLSEASETILNAAKPLREVLDAVPNDDTQIRIEVLKKNC